MRTLAAALTTAQRQPTRRPYLKVDISDRFAGLRRLRPTSWYTGAEPAGPHAAAVPTDGSLNRLRIDGATLYRSRVTSPGAGSDYSVWASFRTGTRLCAIARYGANLVAFAVDDATPTQIHTATSADNGATWSAFALAITHAVTITAIAAAAKSNGDLLAVVNNADNISAYRKPAAGAWSAAVTTANNDLTVTGLACYHQGDYDVIATGTIPTAGGSRLLQRVFGDGFNCTADAWCSPVTLYESAPSSSVAYSAPFLSQPDIFRFTFREAFTGTGTYDRIAHTYGPATADFTAALWKEPTPFNLDSDYGLALSFDASNLYLTNASRVYAWSLALTTLDVTADVLSADVPERPEPATAVIRLNNATATYNTLPAAITLGAEVRIAPGLYDAAGVAQSSPGPSFWITALAHDFTSNPPALEIHAVNVWGVLRAWASPRTIQRAAGTKNAFALLSLLAAYAGPFEFSGAGASAESSSLQPAFLLRPGQDGLNAFRAVLDKLPDTAFLRGEFIYLNEPLAADAADENYTWQANPALHHPITSARYHDRIKDHNHLRVTGGAAANVLGDTVDFAETALWYRAPAIVADREMDTAAEAADRAAALARRDEIASRHDLITAPVHCGLELNDVIAITDSRAGLAAAKRRVLELRLLYSRAPAKNPRYDHVLTLGDP